jgi:hypothetical protein
MFTFFVRNDVIVVVVGHIAITALEEQLKVIENMALFFNAAFLSLFHISFLFRYAL